MPLVPVAEYADRIAADVARMELAASGIEAVLFDSGMAGLGLGFMTPVRLMVEAEDGARATGIVARGA